jgi:predicted O-methyltransferase YrrM
VLRRDAPDVGHLAFYEEMTVGPVQRDEALLLHGLVLVVRPRTVVEFGFHLGHSAYNFLRALDADSRLYSFDIDPRCEQVAQRRFADDPRFVYRTHAQEKLTPGDIDGRVADLVFVDGAHDLALNQETFGRLLPLMSPDAIVAIHDTGTIGRAFIPDWQTSDTARWIGDGYEHQPDERAFANWVREQHPEFAQIHLHTHRTARQGLTLLQRSGPLPRPPTG